MSYPMVNAVQWGIPGWPNIHASYSPVFPRAVPWSLLPQGAFLIAGDGAVPRVRRSGEHRHVECGGDALGDDFLHQGEPEAWPGKDPDAVVNLVGERAREPEAA